MAFHAVGRNSASPSSSSSISGPPSSIANASIAVARRTRRRPSGRRAAPRGRTAPRRGGRGAVAGAGDGPCRGRRRGRRVARRSPRRPRPVPARRQPGCAAAAAQPRRVGWRAGAGDAGAAPRAHRRRQTATTATPKIERWCSTRSTPGSAVPPRSRWGRRSPRSAPTTRCSWSPTCRRSRRWRGRQVVVSKEVRDGQTFASVGAARRRAQGRRAGADAVRIDRRGRPRARQGAAPAQ